MLTNIFNSLVFLGSIIFAQSLYNKKAIDRIEKAPKHKQEEMTKQREDRVKKQWGCAGLFIGWLLLDFIIKLIINLFL